MREHHPVGDLRHEVVVGGGAEGGADPGGEVEVLDRGGQAPERTGPVGRRRAERGGSLAGLLGGVVHEGTDVVEPLDAVEVVLGQLERGRLAATDERPLLERGQVVQVGHVPEPIPSPGARLLPKNDDAAHCWVATATRRAVRITRTLLATLGRDVPSGRVLDWGCGGGANAVVLAPLCDELVALDVSGESLEECRRQVLDRTGRAVRTVLTHADGPERAVEAVGEGTVDLVVSYYVFELLASRETAVRVLRTIRRLLADDGAAVIQFKYDDGTRSGATRRRDYRRRVAGTTFAIHDFWTLCDQQGLTPHTLVLVPRDELDTHYAYVLLTRPPG